MKLSNTYYMLRHGEAISNAKNTFSSWPETFENPLTENGVAMIEASADILATKQIDMIFASDIFRTKQTAQIVAEKLGLEITFDARLREIGFGSMNGNMVAEVEKQVARYAEPGYKIFGGESYHDVAQRMKDFFDEINEEHQGKTILIVSHQSSLWLLEEVVKGLPLLAMTKIPGYVQMDRGEVRELTTKVPVAIKEGVAL